MIGILGRGRRAHPLGSAAGSDRQGLTLVHFSAQPETFLTQNTSYILPSTPEHTLSTPYMHDLRTPYPTQSAYVEPKSGLV